MTQIKAKANMEVENVSWEVKARTVQQLLYKDLGDRDCDSYKGNQNKYLLKNIGYALCGPPDEEPSEINKKTGYSPKMLEVIEKMCKIIKDNDDHVRGPQDNLTRLIRDYINKHIDRKVKSTNPITRSYHVSEICKIMEAYNEEEDEDENDAMKMKLHVHIASAIYDTSVSAETLFNSLFSNEMLSKVFPIYKNILYMTDKYHESTNTLMSTIFVVLKVEHENQSHAVPEPVFRVPNDSDGVGNNRFIDRNLRVYKGWDKYLENNELPEGPCCYPVSGIYNGDEDDHVIVAFGETPAGASMKKALSVGDTVGTVFATGATVVGLVSLIPAITIAGPILLGAVVGSAVTGAYGVGRGVGNLVDRSRHDQEMGLQNAEARNAYISIAGGALGMCAMGATTATAMLAREGQVVGSLGRFAVNALQISSLTVNGVGIFTTAFQMHEKYKQGNLTRLDVFQFSSSVLFLTMSAVSFRTANTIIKETQQATLNDYRANNLRSNRHRKGFDKISRNTRRGLDTMEGNAKVIRSINNINNPNDFFSGVVRINKHHRQSEASLSFADTTGNVMVNNALRVEPSSFADLSRGHRNLLLDASRNLDNGSLTRSGFETIINNVSVKSGMSLDSNRVILESKLYQAFGASSLQELDHSADGIVCSLLNGIGAATLQFLLKDPMVSAEILKAGMRLCNKIWDNVIPDIEELEILFEFTCKFVANCVKIMEAVYQTALQAGLNQPNFNPGQFDAEYGIAGDRTKHFIDCVVQLYSLAMKIIEFKAEYEVYRANRRVEA